MKLHIGDHVVVITGKDKGKTGSVLRVLQGKNRVVIGGINMRTRHMRATPQQAGQRIQYEASLHVSNVMLIDPKTKKRTRIGAKIDDKGKKTRIARGSGEVLPAKKAGASTIAKSDTKSSTKKSPAKTKAAATSKEAAAKPSALPAKQPFWKKVTNFGSAATAEVSGDDAPVSSRDHSVPSQTPPHQTRSASRSS
jgi:large subunit ribosomal protein L24